MFSPHAAHGRATSLPVGDPEPRVSRIAEIAERIFVVAVFCGLSGSLERLRYSLLNGTIMQLLTWLLLAISVALIARQLTAAAGVVRNLGPNLLMVALVVLSISWSVGPGWTFRAGLALVAPTAFAIYVAVRFSPRQQLELLQGALYLVALYSLLVALLDPRAFGADGMRGWFTSKNHLGRCASLGVLVSCVSAFGLRHRLASAIGGVLCLAVLTASDSRSAMIVAPLCLGLFGILCLAQSFRAQAGRILGAATAAVLVLVAVALRHAEVVFAWMGRNATLSARTKMWRVLFSRWAVHPWLGYGYGAFWHGWKSPAGPVIAQLRYYPWHAHNGFLDLALDLGVVGLALFLIILLFYGRQALQLGLGSKARQALWPATYLGYFILSNLTESELVRHDSIYWVTYLLVTAQLGASGRWSAADSTARARPWRRDHEATATASR